MHIIYYISKYITIYYKRIKHAKMQLFTLKYDLKLDIWTYMDVL